MKLKLSLFFFTLSISSGILPGFSQKTPSRLNYTVRHFTPANGLGSSQTRGITQDSVGYIWIASSIGLSRYDGYNFKVYKFDPDNSFRSSFQGGIFNLTVDQTGNLWILSEILSKYDAETDGFLHYKPSVDTKIVTRFCFDRQEPVVWMGTHQKGLYEFDTETGQTINHLNSHPDSLTNAKMNSIWGISDRDSFLLVATRNGLWQFDKIKKSFSRPESNLRDRAFLYETAIWNIIDRPNYGYNDTWLVLENGLVKLDEKCSVVDRFHYADGFRSNAYWLDSDGIFWFLTTKNERFRYNPADGSSGFVEIMAGGEPFILERNFFVDRDRNVWSGSETDGVFQLIPKTLLFRDFKFPAPGTWTVSTLYKTNDQERLVLIKGFAGTNNEIWTARFLSTSLVDSPEFKQIKTETPLEGIIMSTHAGKNTLWICSWRHGISGMPINPETGLFDAGNQFTLRSDPTDPNTVSNVNNGYIFEDQDENLWVASRGHGISKIVSSKPYGTEGSVIHYQHQEHDSSSISHNFSLKFYPGEKNSLWALTWAGVDLFRDEKFERVFKNLPTPRTLVTDSDGNLLIGTLSGLYHATADGNQYDLRQVPLLEKYGIDDIQEDSEGRLWLTNPLANRLVCYDRNENVGIEFNEQDGLPSGITDFSQTSKGVMVLTTINGFTLFNPSSVQIKRSKTLPVLTRLRVNNQVPSLKKKMTSQGEFSLNHDISVLHELTLDYLHNNFAIDFSAMEMTSPEKNLYRYKLDGYDGEWIETDSKNRTATYTNLDAGEYIFKVRASNYHGIWSDQERTLIIHVLPPPWKTWWAYSLYAVAFFGLILAWRRYDIKRVKLKHRAEHLSELDQLKSRFFANISHEFRTPITLILGPLKKLYNRENVKEHKEELGSIMRNGQRLHRLINQLLDLSKIEAGKMRLYASPVELVEFLREIAASYESLAVEKKIKYFFYPEVDQLGAYIDPEKMEKIVHNVLSNAFKFTSAGEIILNLKADKDHCFITVKDTGIGIPSNQLEKVFDRFYQVDSSQTRDYEGSGLGMALAKELVELHKGKIFVQSTEGKGTTFTVILPLGKEHLSKDDITDAIHHTEREQLSDNVVSSDIGQEETVNVSDGNLPLILIVEDNADMRNYIRKALAGEYQVMEAENGKSGVKAAEETIPDLIISDIMMPEMDGYKLCSIIKSSELTSHIPVILLTAKADRESKLAGLETGADDYLSKPFDADELKLIVHNHIEARRKMRERFSREVTLEPKQISITSLDEKFLERVMGIIEAHMDDEHFSIDEFSREAGFSNMHFYRKIKALSGETPSQFLRTIRLKRAAELLANNSDNVTQVAYAVGFSSLSYFNKCFKEQFGVTPGQYADGPFKPKI